MQEAVHVKGIVVTKIAAEAYVDRQTVYRYLRGNKVKDSSRHLIETALAKLERLDLKRAEAC